MWRVSDLALPCLLLLIRRKEAMEWKAPPNVAPAGQAMEEAVLKHVAGQAMKADRGTFLFCVPLQVGPATPYARNVQHWMKGIVVLQACTCVLRFVALKDVVGGFWMVLICGLGWYAWQEDMNITYVCCWGLASIVNSFFDMAALAISVLFSILKLDLFDIILRTLPPLSELLGAGFAWHLYLDYFEHGQGQGSAISGFLGQLHDPMGKLVNTTDPAEYKSLLRAATDKEVRGDLARPFVKAGSAAAAAAAARFASPKPPGRYPRTPQGLESETQMWQQHEEALQRQAEDQSQHVQIERLQNELSHSQVSAFQTHDQDAAAPFAMASYPSPPTATRKTYAACC